MSAPLGRFRIAGSPDRYNEPAVICNDCDETVCTVEHDDTLELIWRTAQEHDCEVTRCRFCEDVISPLAGPSGVEWVSFLGKFCEQMSSDGPTNRLHEPTEG